MNNNYYKMMKEVGFYESEVPTFFLDVIMSFITKNVRLLYYYYTDKKKYQEHKKFKIQLNKIKRLQRLYYKKEIDIINDDLKYDKKTIPIIFYNINDRVLTLKCYFDGKAIDKDYERLKNEIITSTGLQRIEDELKGGYYYLQLGLINNEEQLKPTFLYEMKDVEEYSFPLGDCFGKTIFWNYKKFPHALIIGPNGSGKTSFMRYLLSSILPVCKCWCIDGKAVDYTTSKHLFERYCDIEDDNSKSKIIDMINDYYNLMNERKAILKKAQNEGIMANDTYDLGLKPVFLIIEEFTSIIEMFTKKDEREELNRKIGIITRLGRGFGTQILFIMQRPDTVYIKGEIRNNLTCKIVLGTPDDQTYSMVFGNQYSDLTTQTIGKGYVKIENRLRYIEVPYCKSIITNSQEMTT